MHCSPLHASLLGTALAGLGALFLATGATGTAAAAGSLLRFVQGDYDPLVEPAPVAPELTLERAPEGPSPWVVQFSHPTGAAESALLSEAGAEVRAYLPDHAYLVVATPGEAAVLREAEDVRWVGPYEPGLRIAPSIGSMSFRDPARAAALEPTLIVRVFSDPLTAADRFRALGADVLEVVDQADESILVLTLPSERIADLARDPLTWYVEEKPETFVLNQTTRWVVQSNISNLTPIWDEGVTGLGEIVTLMDSGVDYNSCFFRENGNLPPGPAHRKILDYQTFGGNAYDGCGTGHGTHVAGTIAGDQSYVTGSTQHAGMAFDAQLTVQDVGADGFFDCLFGFVNVPSSLTSAFTSSYNLGARIHSNSWGSTSNAYDVYAVNVDQFMWNNPDFLVVFANGNSGPGGSTVGSPATAKNLISVGATQQAPNQNTIASYSSRGPASDTRFKPTVVAPGGDSNGYIVSADNQTGNPPSPTCNTQGSPFAGTSMATPAVAGLAALTRQYFRDGFYPDGIAGGSPVSVTAAAVKAVLVNAASDVATPDIPNNNEGFGRLLLSDGLFFDGDSRELRLEQDGGVGTGGSRSFVYEVDSSSEPLEVVLCWTDYPATQGAGVALVNDLDLVVTAPGGVVYLGNRLSGGQSTTGGSADRRNVEEIFRLNAPPVGTYTIEVIGFNVPQGGTQPFALASTGSFAGWPDDPASIPDVSAIVGGGDLIGAEPNPFAGEITLTLRAHDAAAVGTLEIFDSSGRRVRSLHAGALVPGISVVRWDGRDDAGTAVAPGVYFARARSGGVEASRKLVLVN